MLSHFIFYSNTAPHKHSSPSYQHKTCPKCESLDLSPWPSSQCPHTITAVGRGPSSILSPQSGMAFPITLEHYNPSHSSKKLINCYSSTLTYIDHCLCSVCCLYDCPTDVWRAMSLLCVACKCDVWCALSLLHVICVAEQEPAGNQLFYWDRPVLNCNFVTFNSFLYNKYKK